MNEEFDNLKNEITEKLQKLHPGTTVDFGIPESVSLFGRMGSMYLNLNTIDDPILFDILENFLGDEKEDGSPVEDEDRIVSKVPVTLTGYKFLNKKGEEIVLMFLNSQEKK